MKQKAILPIAVTSGCIVVLWIIGRLTGALQYYSVPAESNAPTFRPGTHFFITSLKKPKRNDFVAYRRDDPQFGQAVWCHRMVAISGDIVQVKDGVVSVNGAKSDEGLNLMHEYAVAGAEKSAIIDADPDLNGRPLGGDTVLFSIPDEVAANMHLHTPRYVYPVNAPDPTVQQQFGKPWNADQFGPLRVPAQHYFLMGDNRHNALDSRYIGFIAAQDVIGTVIGR